MKNQFRLILIFAVLLCLPALCYASITILTSASPHHTITSGSNEQVYGTSTSNQITLESGAEAELINFPGQNNIQIQSSSDLFTVSRSGAMVTFEGSDGTILKIPATTDIQAISFNDIDSSLFIDNSQVMLGENQVISLSKVSIGQNQDPCTYSISPTSGSFNSSGENSTVSVTASYSSCEWIASESLDWVSLSPAGGTGSGSITITTTENTGAARTGSITIAGETYSGVSKKTTC